MAKRNEVGRLETRLKEVRESKQMSQVELAKRIGCTRPTITLLEANKHNPSLILAYDIAEVLETTIEDLFLFDRKK